MTHLSQSIYNLKLSCRIWNQIVFIFFTSLRFKAINVDLSIFIRHKAKNRIIGISIYIDNFLIAIKYQKSLDWTKKKLKRKYNIKDLGEIKTIIEWQLTQNHKLSILEIDQSVFICSLVEEKNMQDCNLVNIPIKIGNFINMQMIIIEKLSIK